MYMSTTRKYGSLKGKLVLAVLGALLMMALPTMALADSPSFLRTEVTVLGSELSGSWRSLDLLPGVAYGQIGGEGMKSSNEVGAPVAKDEDQAEDGGPSNLGTKVKAAALSAVFPGAGQFYNGQKKKAYIMGGIEVAIWTTYFIFDAQGDNRLESSTEYADIYAGTSGSHHDSYWQSVGRYMDSDAYYEAQLREARALGEPMPSPPTAAETWQWVNEDRKDEFGALRADANSAYDRRDFTILFAVVNRAVSVVDAVLGVGKADGKLDTEVLGMNMKLEMLPSWRDPGTQLTFSRGF